jgi:phosphatidylglycerol---prolipoprotein diacylglyceryl transferase
MSLLPYGLKFGPLTLTGQILGGLLAFVLAVLWLKRDMLRQGGNGEGAADALAGAIVLGMLGARVSAFLVAPAESFHAPLLTLLSGGVPFTGWIGTGLALFYFVWKVQKLRLSWPSLLDALARSAVLALGVYALFVAQAGKPSDLPWAVQIANGTYHPLNLYQALAAFLAFYWLQRAAHTETRGTGFFRAMFWLGCLSLLLSFFRVQVETTGGLAVEQWGWLSVAVLGLAGLAWRTGGEADDGQQRT